METNTPIGAAGAGTGATQAQSDPETQTTPTPAVIPGTETAPPTPTPGIAPLSNADIKAHPWLKEQLTELVTLRKEKEARVKSEADAEQAKLLEKGEFEKALSLEREKRETAEKNALRAEIRAALIARGADAGSEGLFKVATAEYDATQHETIDIFADALKAGKVYAAFFADQGRQAPPDPPGKPPAGGNTYNWKEVQAWETGPDRLKRIEARKLINEYKQVNGKYPY
jgi:hypothetical protein